MITINHQNLVEKPIGADEIAAGDLFYDSDGDLYLRLDYGCIMFTDGGDTVSLMENFTEDNLTDYDIYDYLKECTRAKGKVSVTIDLEE